MHSTESDEDAIWEIARRVLPASGTPIVERTAEGVSTPVYRIHRGGVTLYLRLAESPTANLAPEVLVHQQLRERGVRVPEVVYFEPCNEALGRSVMVTTEIPGSPIGPAHHHGDLDTVFIEAGRQLALIHTIPVEGFGWIRRDQPDATRLQATLPTLQAFALDELSAHLTILNGILAADELRAIDRAIVNGMTWFSAKDATLVHGDIDTTHVFHDRGVYSGIIDFGEIRGADPFYDLGHFALHDGERIPARVLPFLLTGYGEVTPLPPDTMRRARLWSLLIGMRTLARSVTRPQGTYRKYLLAAIRRDLASATSP